MTHVTEEDLVLYHYGEGQAETVGLHLSECTDCLAQYELLQRLLGAMDRDAVPERSESYPEEVWQLLSARLPGKKPVSWRSVFSVPRLRFAAALALLLVVAFLLGRFTSDGNGEPIPGQVRERILLVAVGDHLERSQRLLIELVNAEGTETADIEANQRKAEELAASNRLYRQSAARGNDPMVTQLLEELERTLLEVANVDPETAASDLDQLRRRIEKRGILFRVRVIGDKVREGAVTGSPAGQV